MGRPRVLDEEKKSEICALVTAGMSLTKVADYVGCDRKTIYREREQDEQFDQRMRRAGLACDLKPLEAMRRAASTHWRAAAWMIDRQDRREAERRARNVRFTKQELLELAEQVKQMVSRAALDPFDGPVLVQKIENLFVAAEPGAVRRRPGQEPRGPSVSESIKFLSERWANRKRGLFAGLRGVPSPSLSPEGVEELSGGSTQGMTSDSPVPSRYTQAQGNVPNGAKPVAKLSEPNQEQDQETL